MGEAKPPTTHMVVGMEVEEAMAHHHPQGMDVEEAMAHHHPQGMEVEEAKAHHLPQDMEEAKAHQPPTWKGQGIGPCIQTRNRPSQRRASASIVLRIFTSAEGGNVLLSTTPSGSGISQLAS